ncbi:MAG: hypothetical protein Q9167_003942 [Letrouitia subvulpina]
MNYPPTEFRCRADFSVEQGAESIDSADEWSRPDGFVGSEDKPDFKERVLVLSWPPTFQRSPDEDPKPAAYKYLINSNQFPFTFCDKMNLGKLPNEIMGLSLSFTVQRWSSSKDIPLTYRQKVVGELQSLASVCSEILIENACYMCADPG